MALFYSFTLPREFNTIRPETVDPKNDRKVTRRFSMQTNLLPSTWEQTPEEVTVSVKGPAGTPAKFINCQIKKKKKKTN
jgi:thiamine biosynthesis protein ThiC